MSRASCSKLGGGSLEPRELELARLLAGLFRCGITGLMPQAKGLGVWLLWACTRKLDAEEARLLGWLLLLWL